MNEQLMNVIREAALQRGITVPALLRELLREAEKEHEPVAQWPPAIEKRGT